MMIPEPEMNAEQGNANQSVNENYSNNNYPADNPVAQTVQNGERASGKDTENVSEIFSAKYKCEERMKIFEIEFETELLLEQESCERRKLELEMPMKELETRHQILEEQREQKTEQKWREQHWKMLTTNQLINQCSRQILFQPELENRSCPGLGR